MVPIITQTLSTSFLLLCSPSGFQDWWFQSDLSGVGVLQSCQLLDNFTTKWNIMCKLMVSSSSLQDPLEIVFFCIFSNTVLHLHSFFIGLHLDILFRFTNNSGFYLWINCSCSPSEDNIFFPYFSFGLLRIQFDTNK